MMVTNLSSQTRNRFSVSMVSIHIHRNESNRISGSQTHSRISMSAYFPSFFALLFYTYFYIYVKFTFSSMNKYEEYIIPLLNYSRGLHLMTLLRDSTSIFISIFSSFSTHVCVRASTAATASSWPAARPTRRPRSPPSSSSTPDKVDGSA
jgi:hypothetical protein